MKIFLSDVCESVLWVGAFWVAAIEAILRRQWGPALLLLCAAILATGVFWLVPIYKIAKHWWLKKREKNPQVAARA